MSELLLRGHNPAKSYLEDGADIVLENGLRIEIKSSHRRPPTKRNPRGPYSFSIGNAANKYRLCRNADYYVCWAITDDWFYIIPASDVQCNVIAFVDSPKSKRNWSKYIKYKGAWHLLTR